jgi:hypothetical protein
VPLQLLRLCRETFGCGRRSSSRFLPAAFYLQILAKTADKADLFKPHRAVGQTTEFIVDFGIGGQF